MTLFWDGDPSTQSFIKIVGLSPAPQISPRSHIRTSSRPASAPAREVHTAHTFRSSPRQARPTTHHGTCNAASNNVGRATTDVSRTFYCCEQSGVDSSGKRCCVSFQHAANHYYHRDELERGRTRALEHRLRRLEQDNTHLRDAMLNKHNDWGLKRGVDDTHRRSLEMIAALLTAKKGAEKKSRTQDNARDRQVPLLLAMLYIQHLLSQYFVRSVKNVQNRGFGANHPDVSAIIVKKKRSSSGSSICDTFILYMYFFLLTAYPA